MQPVIAAEKCLVGKGALMCLKPNTPRHPTFNDELLC